MRMCRYNNPHLVFGKKRLVRARGRRDRGIVANCDHEVSIGLPSYFHEGFKEYTISIALLVLKIEIVVEVKISEDGIDVKVVVQLANSG